MGKLLSELPDEEPPSDPNSEQEYAILNNILQVDNKSPKEYARLKYVLFASLIFLIMVLPITDRLLTLAVPMTNSWLMMVGVKTVAFFVLLYLFTLIK